MSKIILMYDKNKMSLNHTIYVYLVSPFWLANTMARFV